MDAAADSGKIGYESTDSFHFCAADLQTKLKFADASVTLDRWNGKSYTIITVVEPEYKHLVNYRATPTEEVKIPAFALDCKIQNIYLIRLRLPKRFDNLSNRLLHI